MGLSAVLGLAGESQDFFAGYLVNFAFFVSISLGALLFVVLQHLTQAGWSVVVRRLSEALAMNVALLAVLVIPLLFGLSSIYK